MSIGGDDITEFLYVLLNKIRFPYKEMDLNRMHDWAVIEDLKCRICTLNEVRLLFILWMHADVSVERSRAECVRLLGAKAGEDAREVWIAGLR